MLFKKVELTEEMEDGVRVATIGHGHIRTGKLDDSSSVTLDGVEYIDHGNEVAVNIAGVPGVTAMGVYGLWEGSNGKNLILAEW